MRRAINNQSWIGDRSFYVQYYLIYLISLYLYLDGAVSICCVQCFSPLLLTGTGGGRDSIDELL